MSKILVLFHSNSGNTEKMARLVAEGAASIEGSSVRCLSITEAKASDLAWCEGIALGSPTNLGSVSHQMKEWWDTEAVSEWMKIDGKIACAFSSSGGWGGGSEMACLSLMTILMNFGFLVFGVTDYVGKKMTLHYGTVLAGEPREEAEIEACRRLGIRLAEWVAVNIHGKKEHHPNHASYPRRPEEFG